jgi:hypothetical protein
MRNDNTVDLLAAAASQSSTQTQPMNDLELVEHSLQMVTSMLDRVLTYVRAVLAGEVKGDPVVGRYLLDTVGASTEELEKGAFGSSLQVRAFATVCADIVVAHRVQGHADDLVPRKPRSSASGIVFETSIGHSCMMMYNKDILTEDIAKS